MAPPIYRQFEALAIREIDSTLSTILFTPPGWTRLEPQSQAGTPAAGIAARIADPLWMIGRQWQLGEFRGEDCGSPVAVEVAAESRALTGLRSPEGVTRALGPGASFEPEIEAEPWAPPCLRDRAEAAAALIAALSALDWGGEAELLARCPFDLAAADLAREPPDACWRLIARRLPDAERAAEALESGTPPSWLAGDAAPLLQAAQDWLVWYRRNVSRRTEGAEFWKPDRLEYRFALEAGDAAAPEVLNAPCHLGGPVDWYSFDLAKAASAAAAPRLHRSHVPATRLSYVGMPSTRMWQFEDGLVNLGVTEVQPHDLARLVFLEFATVFGNDWLLAPIDLPRGVLARVTAVSYTDSFGGRISLEDGGVPRRGADGARGRFALFATDGPTGAEPGFVIPPNGRPALEGEPREEVIFARDETANMVWAIERSIEGADGRPRDPARDARPGDTPAHPQPGADAAWTLEVRPPGNWVPIVPVPVGSRGGFALRKGSFDGSDPARSRLLAPVPFDLQDEEVPREGLRVRRVPSVLRNEEGLLCRWIARRVGPAFGESRSRLEYDATRDAADS